MALPSGVDALTNAKLVTNNTNMISVTPSIVDQVISPEKSAIFNVTITNLSNQPMPLYASTAPFDNNGYIDNGATQWFVFQQPDLLILPHQSQTENITVNIPKNAEAGAHYATIYFTPLVPVNSLQSNKSPIILRVGVLATIIVTGDIKQSAYIGAIKASIDPWEGPVTLSLRLVNNGNVYLLPHGSLVVYKNRKPVKSFQLGREVIFPNKGYTFTRVWSKHPLLGSYQLKGKLIYGSNNVILESSINFSVTPWDLIIEAGILLAVLGALYKVFRKRLWRAFKALLFKNP
jgi:hypothetical protein